MRCKTERNYSKNFISSLIIDEPRDDSKQTKFLNQFDYSDRTTQTYNNPLRVSYISSQGACHSE